MSFHKLRPCVIVIGLLIPIAFAQLSCADGGSRQEGVFIHISNGVANPHRVLMALSMAGMMATSRDVLVYCDIEGIEVVLENAPDLTYSHFTASKAQLAKLIEMGVGVYACPGCLKAAGKTAEDLMAGVKLADKDAFFAFTEGRILTLDY